MLVVALISVNEKEVIEDDTCMYYLEKQFERLNQDGIYLRDSVRLNTEENWEDHIKEIAEG